MATFAVSRPRRIPAQLLWLAQSVLAIAFGIAGLITVMTPMPALVNQMPWAADLPPALVRAIGLAEVTAAVGLIAPAATGVAVALVPVSAAGLAFLMACALLVNVQRGEFDALPVNIGLGLLAGFVAWTRAGALRRPQRTGV